MIERIGRTSRKPLPRLPLLPARVLRTPGGWMSSFRGDPFCSLFPKVGGRKWASSLSLSLLLLVPFDGGIVDPQSQLQPCPSYACSPLCPVRCQLLQPPRNHYADRQQRKGGVTQNGSHSTPRIARPASCPSSLSPSTRATKATSNCNCHRRKQPSCKRLLHAQAGTFSSFHRDAEFQFCLSFFCWHKQDSACIPL